MSRLHIAAFLVPMALATPAQASCPVTSFGGSLATSGEVFDGLLVASRADGDGEVVGFAAVTSVYKGQVTQVVRITLEGNAQRLTVGDRYLFFSNELRVSLDGCSPTALGGLEPDRAPIATYPRSVPVAVPVPDLRPEPEPVPIREASRRPLIAVASIMLAIAAAASLIVGGRRRRAG